jgi:hypothetical protein
MHLTEDQRKKLVDRESRDFTPTERRNNEFAIRNRLKEFLEFLPDAILIIEKLPKEQLRKNKKLVDVINDKTVQGLFDLTENLLDLLDYMPIQGSSRKPYVTKILSDREGDVIVRTANDLDFARNGHVHNHVARLADYYQADARLWMNQWLIHGGKKIIDAQNEMKDREPPK